MANPFSSDDIAAGYGQSRPAVHALVLERVAKRLEWREPFSRVLDVGCGAGASTRAIAPHARRCIGLEPSAAMLHWATATAPRAEFVVGRAEAIPLCRSSVELITAAGSLNYADLQSFFPEAARVLAPLGDLVVYDFETGSSFREGRGLQEWFPGFLQRYPRPAYELQRLDPETLARSHSAFQLRTQERFEIGIEMGREFYLNYLMTELNVAAAVLGGTARSKIRAWCAGSLARAWPSGTREVLFRGYFACMRPV